MIHDTDEARFLALQDVLDHHPLAGRPERPVAKRRLESTDRLVHRLRHGDSLPSREPVRLDHDGRAPQAHVIRGGVETVEGLVAGGGNAMSFEKRLRECLRALETRGGRARTETGEAFARERIGDACDERRFRADDGEPDPAPCREVDETLHVLGRDRDVLDSRLAGGSRIARRHVDPLDPLGCRELPGERVLASSAADDQCLHLRSASNPVSDRLPRTPRKPGRLVPEVPDAGEHHRHPVLVRRRDDLAVAP